MTLSVRDVPFVLVPFSDASLVPRSDIRAAQNMRNQGNLTATWLTSQNGEERQPGGVVGSVSSLGDVCPQICLQNPQKLSDRLWMFLCGEDGARKRARSPEHCFMGSAHYLVPVRLRQGRVGQV